MENIREYYKSMQEHIEKEVLREGKRTILGGSMPELDAHSIEQTRTYFDRVINKLMMLPTDAKKGYIRALARAIEWEEARSRLFDYQKEVLIYTTYGNETTPLLIYEIQDEPETKQLNEIDRAYKTIYVYEESGEPYDSTNVILQKEYELGHLYNSILDFGVDLKEEALKTNCKLVDYEIIVSRFKILESNDIVEGFAKNTHIHKILEPKIKGDEHNRTNLTRDQLIILFQQLQITKTFNYLSYTDMSLAVALMSGLSHKKVRQASSTIQVKKEDCDKVIAQLEATIKKLRQ